jgi:hypothetical protein
LAGIGARGLGRRKNVNAWNVSKWEGELVANRSIAQFPPMPADPKKRDAAILGPYPKLSDHMMILQRLYQLESGPLRSFTVIVAPDGGCESNESEHHDLNVGNIGLYATTGFSM